MLCCHCERREKSPSDLLETGLRRGQAKPCGRALHRDGAGRAVAVVSERRVAKRGLPIWSLRFGCSPSCRRVLRARSGGPKCEGSPWYPRGLCISHFGCFPSCRRNHRREGHRNPVESAWHRRTGRRSLRGPRCSIGERRRSPFSRQGHRSPRQRATPATRSSRRPKCGASAAPQQGTRRTAPR